MCSFQKKRAAAFPQIKKKEHSRGGFLSISSPIFRRSCALLWASRRTSLPNQERTPLRFCLMEPSEERPGGSPCGNTSLTSGKNPKERGEAGNEDTSREACSITEQRVIQQARRKASRFSHKDLHHEDRRGTECWIQNERQRSRAPSMC